MGGLCAQHSRPTLDASWCCPSVVRRGFPRCPRSLGTRRRGRRRGPKYVARPSGGLTSDPQDPSPVFFKYRGMVGGRFLDEKSSWRAGRIKNKECSAMGRFGWRARLLTARDAMESTAKRAVLPLFCRRYATCIYGIDITCESFSAAFSRC